MSISRLGVGDQAGFAEIDLAHVHGVADDGDHRVARLRQRRDIRVPDRTARDQVRRLVAATVVHMQGITRVEQVPGHALAHDAGADEADVLQFALDAHARFPLVRSVLRTMGAGIGGDKAACISERHASMPNRASQPRIGALILGVSPASKIPARTAPCASIVSPPFPETGSARK
jgi:hypothetical protein